MRRPWPWRGLPLGAGLFSQTSLNLGHDAFEFSQGLRFAFEFEQRLQFRSDLVHL